MPLALFGLPDGIIHNADDLKKLPVVRVPPGIGDRSQPSYHLDDARGNNRFHLYAQDGWKVTPKLHAQLRVWAGSTRATCSTTICRKPAYLAPIYGSDLSPTKSECKNFAPAAGLRVERSARTVRPSSAAAPGSSTTRQLGWWRLGERARSSAVPAGSSSATPAVTNPATGQPFSDRVPQLAAVTPTAQFLTHAADAARAAGCEVSRHRRHAADSALEAGRTRSARSTRTISRRRRRTTYNVGFQRELNGELSIADRFRLPQDAARHAGRLLWRQRRLTTVSTRIDGPVIPTLCDHGARPTIRTRSAPPVRSISGGRARRRPTTACWCALDKRLSHRYQFDCAYALQSSKSIRDVTQNLNDYFATYGPDLAAPQPHGVGAWSICRGRFRCRCCRRS